MEFELFHKRFFDAKKGTYSVVTNREEVDSQITLTDFETEMVMEYFGHNNIQIGNVSSNSTKAKKQFFRYPELTKIELNLVYPKPEKRELRLYLSKQKGFKPLSGEIWFLYIDKMNRLIIGSLPDYIWNDLDQIDAEDEEYLKETQEDLIDSSKLISPPSPQIIPITTSSRKTFKRNGLISAFALAKANYTCEIDTDHKTFISQRTNLPYSESHHFIPMKFQNDFNFPLDCVENIISLCPNCHRGFHHGIIDFKRLLIERIYDSRKALNNFDKESMFGFYNSKKPEIFF